MPIETSQDDLLSLSIVIPCYNAAATIGHQLEAIADQAWIGPWEVILADNGSSDETVAVAEQYRSRLPRLTVVDASKRHGAPYARNIGARAASGCKVLLCDSDDEVGRGWLAAMGTALELYDAVGCRIDLEKLNAPWQLSMSGGNTQYEGLQKLHYPPYLTFTGGCALGFQRSVYDAVGGFDERYVYLDDVDFCCRLQLAGFRLQFIREAVVHYRMRSKVCDIGRQAYHWAVENVYLYSRYRPARHRELWRWRTYARAWLELPQRLRHIHRKDRRAALIFWLGWQVGLLRGSVKYGVPPP